MRVAIVGAGISGLAAARTLQNAGHEPVLFEKSRGPGGRCATRRAEGFVWDTGATALTPRGKRLARFLAESPPPGLVAVTKGVHLTDGRRSRPGDPRRGGERFALTGGMTTFARHLADCLELRLETTVERIDREGSAYRVLDERYDAVVLTPPAPQTAALLYRLGEDRPLANCRYRPCVSVGLGFAAELPETPYSALLDDEPTHPLTWISLESVKAPGRAPEGGSAIVVQLSRGASMDRWRDEDGAIAAWIATRLVPLYGDAFRSPVVSTVMRWKYSQPEGYADLDAVNPPGSTLLVAGDSLLGGHVEDAFEVGELVAERLIGGAA